MISGSILLAAAALVANTHQELPSGIRQGGCQIARASAPKPERGHTDSGRGQCGQHSATALWPFTFVMFTSNVRERRECLRLADRWIACGEAKHLVGGPAVGVWLKAPSNATSSPSSTTVVVAGLGLVATLLAGVISERFARRREATAQSGAWNALLFQRYEEPYRQFLATWAGVADAEILREAYRRLCRDAFVPPALTEAFERTVAILSESGNADEVSHATKSLQTAFARTIGDPTGFLVTDKPRKARADRHH